MYFHEPLYTYRSPSEGILEECKLMKGGTIEMNTVAPITVMATIEECRVWMTDGQSTILPPLAPVSPPQPKSDTISTAELLRLVAQGRARIINAPVAVAPVAVAPVAVAPVKAAPCSLETCTGRCGMPLHTRSNVMLAKAVYTGNILWGDLE